MTQTQHHIYQLKRGTSQRWNEVNPILRQGEPGFEYDTGRLKIGDGFTPWIALSYINEGSVFNTLTHNDFPKIGEINIIYKAQEEAALYQWNNITQGYELLSSGEQLIDELIKDIAELQEDVFRIEDLLNGVIEFYGGSATDNLPEGGNIR